MNVDELNKEQLTELKQRWYDDFIYERTGENASMGELASIDELVSDDTIMEEYKNYNFSNDDFDCTAGKVEYIWAGYDTWADGDDTWQVNNVYRYTDEKYLIDTDVDDNDVEILQMLVDKKIIENTDGYSLGYECSPDYIEVFDDKDYYKPIGRFELVA